MALLVGFPPVRDLIRLYQVNKVIHVYICIVIFMFLYPISSAFSLNNLMYTDELYLSSMIFFVK